MYQTRTNEDEFEPRITPKPASRLDCLTIPSVPEVSLIFDKPLSYKDVERTDFHSPRVLTKNLTQKGNVPSPLNINGSYATWKEQNYLCRPQPSKVNDCLTPQPVQSNQNYIVHSYLTEDKATGSLNKLKEKRYATRADAYSGLQDENKIRRKSSEYSDKHNYKMSQVNVTPTKEKHTVRTPSNKTLRQTNLVSPTPSFNEPRIVTDNYIVNENEHYLPSYERKFTTRNTKRQEIAFNDSLSEQNIQSQPVNPNNLQRNELHIPQYLGQQYPYFNVSGYPFPQIHPYSIQNTENHETVKNLLQIINSQNEQIKSLQTQVDRLLKMQEENLKERKKCSCSFKSEQHTVDQFFTNSNNIPTGSNYVTTVENSNEVLHKKKPLKSNAKEYSKENENETESQSELVLTDAQSKQKFMEQKVSIGVMTSFEFTVQNSPFTIDMDDYEKKDNQRKQENMKLCNTGNSSGLRDTNESLRRYKNSFTRIPSAQLENIVEDSESYMSSSQQQSSNLNASTSTKDLEKQAYTELRRDSGNHKSESPKLCKGITSKLNEPENCVIKHLERTSTENLVNYEPVKSAAMQRNTVSTEYNTAENRKYKANTLAAVDQYKRQNMKRDNDSIKDSNSANSSNFYKDYQRSEEINVGRRTNCIEDSLILNGGDLKINERPPTPEPSIHVEMQEYSSDDDSEKVKRSSKVGWTFYNNVLGQVNQLLQNSCVVDDQQQNQPKVTTNDRDEAENKAVLDTVKVATLEQLKKLGISINENPEAKELNNSNKMGFDLSFYPRLDYQANMTQATSAVNETNTSMHMKALALKYLTDEQLAELAVQRQGSTSVKHLMVSNVQGTNMSFATMRYLERYQLLPGKSNVQAEDISKVQGEVTPRIDLNSANPRNSPKTLQRFPLNQTPRTTCPSKILDISTLKQQPKLL